MQINLPPYIDWRYFMDDVYLPFVLDWKAQAFRRSDPLSRPVMAHSSSPLIGSAQDWDFAKNLDIFDIDTLSFWRATAGITFRFGS